jgi:hypothetical protein
MLYTIIDSDLEIIAIKYTAHKINIMKGRFHNLNLQCAKVRGSTIVITL